MEYPPTTSQSAANAPNAPNPGFVSPLRLMVIGEIPVPLPQLLMESEADELFVAGCLQRLEPGELRVMLEPQYKMIFAPGPQLSPAPYIILDKLKSLIADDPNWRLISRFAKRLTDHLHDYARERMAQQSTLAPARARKKAATKRARPAGSPARPSKKTMTTLSREPRGDGAKPEEQQHSQEQEQEREQEQPYYIKKKNAAGRTLLPDRPMRARPHNYNNQSSPRK